MIWEVLFAAEVVNAIVWLAFVAELIYARRRFESWRVFARAHWLDIAIVVLSPPFVVPTELATLRVLRLVRLIAIAGRLQQGAGRITGRQGILYVGALVLFCIFIGGVSIHVLEPNHATTVWEGIWWAIVTVTWSATATSHWSLSRAESLRRRSCSSDLVRSARSLDPKRALPGPARRHRRAAHPYRAHARGPEPRFLTTRD